MSDLNELGDLKVGDPVWFVLKDGLARTGKVSSFFLQEGREPAINVFDATDQKHRYMTREQLSKVPLDNVKKKTHRKSREKKTRRSTRVF
jgi:hypothetical protein